MLCEPSVNADVVKVATPPDNVPVPPDGAVVERHRSRRRAAAAGHGRGEGHGLADLAWIER